MQQIKQRLLPQPKEDRWFGMVFCHCGEPHNIYHCTLLNITTGEMRPSDAAASEASLRAYYAERVPAFAKRLHNGPGECGMDWRTVERFVASQKCRCGQHGPNNDQPYYPTRPFYVNRKAP